MRRSSGSSSDGFVRGSFNLVWIESGILDGGGHARSWPASGSLLQRGLAHEVNEGRWVRLGSRSSLLISGPRPSCELFS